ncbi:hypothetical protein [uncultured Flavobacterium sp.]|uniref:hypothetical protein n=1 Tax=uncultured Flavobacterium sp. TaxID=165435 RepID=UPI002598ECE0|nr:hypothetical protein [uncultured Flavobacterium sp.]
MNNDKHLKLLRDKHVNDLLSDDNNKAKRLLYKLTKRLRLKKLLNTTIYLIADDDGDILDFTYTSTGAKDLLKRIKLDIKFYNNLQKKAGLFGNKLNKQKFKIITRTVDRELFETLF